MCVDNRIGVQRMDGYAGKDSFGSAALETDGALGVMSRLAEIALWLRRTPDDHESRSRP